MSRRVAVIGGGIAGVAAAWASRRAGASVTLFHAQAGATELGSGAADIAPWTEHAEHVEGALGRLREAAASLDAEILELFEALGSFRRGPALVATGGGIVRSATFVDPALLDLSRFAGKRVAVADVERDDWDGPCFARMLSGSRWAVATRTTFEPVVVDLLRHGYERRIAPADLAALHDEPERRERLLRKVNEVVKEQDALLVGPWLGLEPQTVESVREGCRFGIGEITSPPGGAAGLRFALARGALCERLGVRSIETMVTSVPRGEGATWRVLAEREQEPEPAFDGVVLAIGGLVGGGIGLADPSHAASGFRLSLDAPLSLGFDGEPKEFASATYGFDPTTHGGAWLERVGVVLSATTARVAGLEVAGDVVADSTRTMIAAAQSGLRAGKRAALG